MIVKHTREELEVPVHVSADLVSMWDGKEVDLKVGKVIPKGLLIHFQSTNPDVEFVVTEAKIPTRETREVVNPLEENDRGAAFSGLKRGRKPKEDE